MGQPDAPKRNLRDELHAGGTTLGADGGFPWLLVGVGGAAALAAVVWWIAASGDEARPVGEPVVTAPVVPDASQAAAPPPPPPPPPDRTAPLRAAAAALERALTGAELWATVEAAGDVAVVRSAFCAEAALVAQIDAAAADLRRAGVTAVRCLEQHGGTAFERALP